MVASGSPQGSPVAHLQVMSPRPDCARKNRRMLRRDFSEIRYDFSGQVSELARWRSVD